MSATTRVRRVRRVWPGAGRPSVPAIALATALALACIVAGHPDHHPDHGGDFTWEVIPRVENRSVEHRFLGFTLRWWDGASVVYEPYNRFPVLGEALIKLAMSPFPDDAAARVRAARALMLAFFTGAAALAWLALRRLIGDEWLALAATLLAFSSAPALGFANVVTTEGAVGLFAVMLAFHGAAAFAAEGRFGQLVAKVCVALLLDWHVFALVGPLAALGLGAALWRRDWHRARRHFVLGAVAVLFGATVLGVNLAGERFALGGGLGGEAAAGVALAELPTLNSALNRTGIAPKRPIDWPRFARQQLHYLALASTPYAVNHFAVGQGDVDIWRHWHVGHAVAGAVALLTTLAFAVSAKLGRQANVSLAALALAGPVWALAMRHNVAHIHESLFHIGVPLVFFSLALGSWKPTTAPRLTAAIFAVAVIAFAAGWGLMAHASRDVERSREISTLATDIDAVRMLVAGRVVLPAVAWRPWSDYDHIWLHFLHGALATTEPRLADLVLRRGRLGLGHSLTPRNNIYFLYERHAWDAAHRRYERLAAHSPPAAAGGDYQVHFVTAPHGDELLVVRRDCPFAAGMPFAPRYDRSRRPWRLWRMGRVGVTWREPARFFAHIHPVDAATLPASRRSIGFKGIPFPRGQWVWRDRGDCYTVRALPDHPIAKITVGQFRHRPELNPPYENVWEADISPTAASASTVDQQRW